MKPPTSSDSQDFLHLKRDLQAFQVTRLNNTYADLKQDPQYDKLGRFFSKSSTLPRISPFATPASKNCTRCWPERFIGP